jgi:ABC-type sulfate/molybdate transport systems ATPase subunit
MIAHRSDPLEIRSSPLRPVIGSAWLAANGSGKSTLLRIAAGLMQRDAGYRFAQSASQTISFGC